MPRSIALLRPSTTPTMSASWSIITAGVWVSPKARRNMTIWKSGLPKARSSPCRRLRWKVMPMAHHIRTPAPMPRNSPANTRTGPSPAASGTIYPRKPRRPLPRPSSTSPKSDRRWLRRTCGLTCTARPQTTSQKWRTVMLRTHQPGQATFRSILPEDIDWQLFPAFPPSVRLAVVVGHPSEPGPYVIRVKVPGGIKLMPHKHPEDRIYTVMSGVFYIGLGDQFDGDKVQPFPPGSVIVLPGNTSHFHWAKSGEYVTQVTAIGPLGLEYLDPTDDPRKRS